MTTFTIKTSSQFEMIDITDRVQEIVDKTGVQNGVCHVFVPHTTAAVTINENADPAVPRDILTILDRLVPLSGGYRHTEGNSAAHAKSSLVGASETVFVTDGRLILGTWQSLFFCEFDGPRSRRVIVRAISSD